MARRSGILVAALFALMACAATPAHARPRPLSPPRATSGFPGSPWAGVGYIRAPGGPFMTDRHGRDLHFHGVGLVAKCGGGASSARAPGTPCIGPIRGPHLAYVLSPAATDPGRRFTAHDAAALAGLGVTVVRLGIVWEGLEPGPRNALPDDPAYCTAHAAGTPYPALGAAKDPYDAATLDAYLRRTDRIVELLGRAGIRVILDMHQDVYSSAFANPTSPSPWNGEGAPPWAVCTDGRPFGTAINWGGGYAQPAVQSAMHHFFANDVSGDLQGQFMRVWRAVAVHYRGDPDVLAYELYNEPSDPGHSRFVGAELQCDYGGPVHEPASCAASDGAQALADGWIGSLRSADRRHVVFYEPQSSSPPNPETIGIAEPLRFGGLVLAFHLYQPPALLAQIAAERAQTQLAVPGGPPVVMDEFGANRSVHNSQLAAAAADAAQFSWTYWAGLQLHDPTGNPQEYLLDERTRRPWPAKARALAVPYALATAGTPAPATWDPARRLLRFRYAPAANATAPTEIVVPRWTFPHGYAVRVSGARVTSRPRAGILTLVARRRARAVSVLLGPPPTSSAPPGVVLPSPSR